MRTTCIILQVVPLPGLGAIIAGLKNPHSRLTGRGVAQMALVVFGSWPLIIPGAIGLVWAIWDAVRIGRAQTPVWSMPTPDAPPETLHQARDERMAQRQAAREERAQQRAAKRAQKETDREARRAQREAEQEEDDTRFMP